MRRLSDCRLPDTAAKRRRAEARTGITSRDRERFRTRAPNPGKAYHCSPVGIGRKTRAGLRITLKTDERRSIQASADRIPQKCREMDAVLVELDNRNAVDMIGDMTTQANIHEIDTTEAARIIGAAPQLVRRWIRQGRLSARRVAGRCYLLPAVDVLRFARQSRPTGRPRKII